MRQWLQQRQALRKQFLDERDSEESAHAQHGNGLEIRRAEKRKLTRKEFETIMGDNFTAIRTVISTKGGTSKAMKRTVKGLIDKSITSDMSNDEIRDSMHITKYVMKGGAEGLAFSWLILLDQNQGAENMVTKRILRQYIQRVAPGVLTYELRDPIGFRLQNEQSPDNFEASISMKADTGKGKGYPYRGQGKGKGTGKGKGRYHDNGKGQGKSKGKGKGSPEYPPTGHRPHDHSPDYGYTTPQVCNTLNTKPDPTHAPWKTLLSLWENNLQIQTQPIKLTQHMPRGKHYYHSGLMTLLLMIMPVLGEGTEIKHGSETTLLTTAIIVMCTIIAVIATITCKHCMFPEMIEEARKEARTGLIQRGPQRDDNARNSGPLHNYTRDNKHGTKQHMSKAKAHERKPPIKNPEKTKYRPTNTRRPRYKNKKCKRKYKITSNTPVKVYIFVTVISIMLGNIQIIRARTSAAGAHAAVYYKAQSAATRISNSLVGKWGSAKWENKAKNGKSKDRQLPREHSNRNASSTKGGERTLLPSQANGKARQAKIVQKRGTYTGSPHCICGANASSWRSNWVSYTQLDQTYGTKTHQQ